MDLFTNDTTTNHQSVAKLRLPSIRKPSGKCAADFETESERTAFQRSMQRNSEAEMKRQRIMDARARVKVEAKALKKEAKKAKA